MEGLDASIGLLQRSLGNEHATHTPTDPALYDPHTDTLDPVLNPEEDEHVQAPVVGDRYVSHDQVRVMLDNYARHEGFAVSVRASNKISYRWQCVHGGRYRNTHKGVTEHVTLVGQPEEDASSSQDGSRRLVGPPRAQVVRAHGTGVTGRTRRQSTKRTGCPWLVRAGMDDQNLWKITKIILEHNHALSPGDPEIYYQNRIGSVPGGSGHRRKNESTTLEEAELPSSGLEPADNDDPSFTTFPSSFGTQGIIQDDNALPLPELQLEILTPKDFEAQALLDDDDAVTYRDVATQTDPYP